MMLTFALFVGLAVVTVALYAAFILRADIRAATQQMLYLQAERLAGPIVESRTPAERNEAIAGIARFTELDISVVLPDTVLVAPGAGDLGDPHRVLESPEIRAVLAGEPRAFRSETVGDRRLVFVAVRAPSGNFILRVGQVEPSLFLLIRRLQVALLVGMFMALLLSILGSWIAAHQVTRPLRAIRDSARSISEGKFEERIRVDSRATEFQDLARRLNQMSSGFREKIEELQRLARLQNEFIGNVSHEVRNPIFAVGGYLEALGSEGLDPDQRKRYAEKGLANLQRLHNLFNDLIEIARLEYREDLIQYSTFDLQELIQDIAELLRPKAEAKGLQLEVENPPIQVVADRNRIRQVVTNLIDNAIAYTDTGVVRCRYRRRLEKVRIEVVD
ncbi:MAG TPA: HAMP domain-containing sensor histidine kinase, partial [Rhodothermales bacterium]